jgi:hypothetical protein
MARQEIPVDEIREAVKSYPECIIKIRRRNIRGQWSSCGPSFKRPTEDLIDIEGVLHEAAGGGWFHVDALDPNDRTRHVVPPFEIEVEGAERPSTFSRTGAAGFSPGGRPGAPPTQWGPPPVQIIREDGGGAADIAQEHARDYRQDFIAEKQAREADREKFERALGDMNARIADTEKRAQHDLQAAKDRSWSDKLEAMEKRLSQPQTPVKPAIDYAALGTLASSLTGVITAVIASGTARSQQQVESARLAAGEHRELLTTLLKRAPDDGGNAKLMEAMSPIIKSVMEERSPSKMAELVTAHADAAMQNLSIVGQFLDKITPQDSDNPWVDMAKNAVDSITKAAKEMSAYSRSSLSGGAPRGANGRGPAPAQLAPDASPKQIADTIYKAPGLPAGLKTADWYQVFFDLHVQVDPKEISKKIAHLLEHARPVPAPFMGLFEDEQNPPSAYLTQLLQQLPVWQDQSYCRAVLAAFDAAFMTEDDDDDDDEEPEEEPEPVIVTPPPAPVPAPKPQPTAQARRAPRRKPTGFGEPSSLVEVAAPSTTEEVVADAPKNS